jgi:hypothetical protein
MRHAPESAAGEGAASRPPASFFAEGCLISLAVLALFIDGVSNAAPPGTPSAVESRDTKDDGKLNTITIEGERNREVVERQVRAFVSAIAVAPRQETLKRWRTPVCPSVAGLSREEGELLLARVSQVAATAGAPLAREHCRGNLHIIVTSKSDELLKAWSKRDRGLYGDVGEANIRRFVSDSNAVRVWYENRVDSADGSPLRGNPSEITGIPGRPHTFLLTTMRNLTSVTVIVDSGRAQGISFTQLADFVAMVGLAEVRLDTDVGDAPTILHLFANTEKTAPAGLSAWDQAFLRALYHTNQDDISQLAQIKTSVIHDVEP